MSQQRGRGRPRVEVPLSSTERSRLCRQRARDNGGNQIYEAFRQALPGGSNDQRGSNGDVLVMLSASIPGVVVTQTKAKTSTERSRELRKRRRDELRNTRGPRQKGVDNVTKKFLRNFDPEHSEREKRKLHRRLYQGYKRHALYDENGIYMQTGDDLCDCLNMSCAGCHFPCLKCTSPKCGHECRNNRKWTYESIENEGSDGSTIIKNKLLKES